MKISLNEVAQSFKPWDLSIEINGIEYRVRPLTIADKAAMAGLKDRSEEEGYVFFESLFEDPKPAVREWDADTAVHVISVIVGYQMALAKKNGEIAVEQVGKAMQRSK